MEHPVGAETTGSHGGSAAGAPSMGERQRHAPLQGWNTLLQSAPEAEPWSGRGAGGTPADADTATGESTGGDGGVECAAFSEGGLLTAAPEQRVQDALIWLDLEMTGAASVRSPDAGLASELGSRVSFGPGANPAFRAVGALVSPGSVNRAQSKTQNTSISVCTT